MAKGISHRVQCSYRIVIGPLDKVPPCSRRISQDSQDELNSVQFLPQCNSMNGGPDKNTSSYYVRTHCQNTTKQGSTTDSSNASNNSAPDMDHPVTASSSSSAHCSHPRQQETLLHKTTTNDAMSITAEQPLTDYGDTHQPPMQPSNDRVVKQDALLCMGSINVGNEKLPTRYKKRDAGSFKQQEGWRQVETVLTPAVLACYDSTALSWPHRTLEHWVSLDGQRDPNLSLYMLSPLDYTFCIQYTPTHAKEPLTLIFRARSFSLCQEWYSSLYQHFPIDARKPLPEQCDIYLPARDLHIHLPLLTDYQHISMDEVKEVVLDLLKEDANGSTLLGQGQSELLLCWTRKDRAEWIFWDSLMDGTPRSDLIFCPQLIEKDHQLEVRPIQHTPCTIVSSDNMSLQEPPPCEGFLTKVTDFEGRILKSWAPQRFYFASFGRFLFVIPSDKAITPDTKTFAVKADGIDSDANTGLRSFFVEWVENNPMVDLITPFASDPEARTEIRRRSALVAGACGYIDLTQVAYIRRCDYASGQHNGDGRIYSGQDSLSQLHTDSVSTPLLQHHHQEEETEPSWYQQPCIELVMKNGVSIRLQASSLQTCDLWVSCLSDLVLYSNAYLEATRDALGTMDSPRKEGLATDETSTSPLIDTRLWSLCIYTQCHDVVKSGIMYVQSKSIFSQKQFLLTTDGRLHYFSMYKRSGDDGKPIATSLHERKGVLELAGAYVYSGLVSSLDSKLPALLDLPPRLFANGVTTSDSNEDCLFTLWIPKRRRVFSARRQSLIVYGPHQRFSSKGTRWLLLAPSRHEMEHWISSINVTQEQLLRRC